MILARLIEKLTGREHKKQNAAMVRQAVADLRDHVGELSKKLNKYQENDDPLVALMLDIYNDREVQKPYRNGHDAGGTQGDRSR